MIYCVAIYVGHGSLTRVNHIVALVLTVSPVHNVRQTCFCFCLVRILWWCSSSFPHWCPSMSLFAFGSSTLPDSSPVVPSRLLSPPHFVFCQVNLVLCFNHLLYFCVRLHIHLCVPYHPLGISADHEMRDHHPCNAVINHVLELNIIRWQRLPTTTNSLVHWQQSGAPWRHKTARPVTWTAPALCPLALAFGVVVVTKVMPCVCAHRPLM